MAETNFLQAIEMTVYDTAGLTGTYAAINGTGTEEAVNVVKFYNASNVGVTLSYDGSTDQDFIPAGGTFILDLETNASGFGGSSGHWMMRKGQVIYAKGSAGTGNLYFVGYY